jgi:hypothetical protein
VELMSEREFGRTGLGSGTMYMVCNAAQALFKSSRSDGASNTNALVSLSFYDRI